MYLVVHKESANCDSPHGDDHDTTIDAITDIKIFHKKENAEMFLYERKVHENYGYWELIEPEDEEK